NNKLKPETTLETELGMDFTLFDRLGIELTHAQSTTKNQILNAPTSPSLGFATQWQNAGTLANYTWEAAATLPVITKRDFSWSIKSTWDRTRTYVKELFVPDYYTDAGTTQGTASLFLITANPQVVDGIPMNRYGNIWGRRFYTSCGMLPASVQDKCGP